MPEALIDVTRLLDRRLHGRLPTGIDRVSLEYVRYFGARATALVRFAGQWIELSPRDSQRVFEALLLSGNFNSLIRKTVARAFPRSIGRRFSASCFLFNTGHNGLEKMDYVHRLRRSRLKPLFFVHDLIPLTHPEYCRSGESGRHRSRMNMILGTGNGVIANSLATLEELAAYAETNGLPMPPTVVAPLAPPRLPVPVAGVPPLDKPYFVILGTIEPRKNHWLLLQLWRQIVERMGEAAPRLMVIGQRGWECENVVDLLERCESLKGFVFEHSTCTDAELVSLLLHAQALLFPSFTEGYGMPLVEALALGVPVIASDLPVFREIAGDIPEYIDPLDGKRWGELIGEYSLPESHLRLDQRRRMVNFEVPTWNTHFQRVEELLERLRVKER